MKKPSELPYRDAGVDVQFASACLNEMDRTRARNTNVITSPNDFAGLFSIKELCRRFDDPVLVSSTEGIGTKLQVAIECGQFDGLGQDLVALCANDIITKGAEPLFFLDYFATANLRSVPFIKIMNAIVATCDEINCALIGGETAEMPSLYANKHFDLAGFIVGVMERKNLLGALRVKRGDVLLGIASSGLHAHGYSLVRNIMFDKLKHRANDVLWETENSVCTVSDVLLTPTKLYVNAVKTLMAEHVDVHAIAHITDGGVVENVSKIIPPDLCACIDLSCFTEENIFGYLMKNGPVRFADMTSTFNMGVGLVLVLAEQHVAKAQAILKMAGETAHFIGNVVDNDGGLRCQVKI